MSFTPFPLASIRQTYTPLQCWPEESFAVARTAVLVKQAPSYYLTFLITIYDRILLSNLTPS